MVLGIERSELFQRHQEFHSAISQPFSYEETRLRNDLEHKLWISPDFATTSTVIIKSKSRDTIVPIAIPHDISPLYSSEDFAFLSATTRSRFAQLGLEVTFDAGINIAESATLITTSEGDIKQIGFIRVNNYAYRDIHLKEGTKFFYFYLKPETYLQGTEILDRMGNHIQIEGEQNKDWKFWYENPLYPNKNDILGIEFFIDSKSRRWIKPSPEPLLINDGVAFNHNRGQVNNYLDPKIPRIDKNILWIAETAAHLKLSSNVHGIIDSTAKQWNVPLSPEENIHYQINSLVLQANNTFGPVRTEVFSPTEKKLIPQAILTRFAA